MTETKTNTRVTVEDGWAVRDLPNGDQVRARLILDTMGDTEQPEWDAVTPVRERGSYGGINLGDHDGLREVLSATEDRGDGTTTVFRDGTWEHGVAHCDRKEFVRRYLRAFHGVEDAFMFRHRDHQDWADVWVITERVTCYDGASFVPSREAAEAFVQEWSDWASGECYGFESQTRTLRAALEDGEFGWEDADTCWGFIGDAGARYALAEALDVDEADVPAPHEVVKF